MSEAVQALRAQEVWAHAAPGEVAAAVLARESMQLVLGFQSGDVLVLDREGKEQTRIPGDGGRVVALSVTDDGNALAVARPDRVELWGRFGRPIDSLAVDRVRCLALRRRDGALFLGREEGSVIAVLRGEPRSRMVELPFRPMGIVAGEGGWEFFAGDSWGDCALYDEGLQLRWRVRLNSHAGQVCGDTAGDFLLVPNRDLGVCAFDPLGSSLGAYETPTPADRAVVAPGGERLAVADDSGSLYLLTRHRGFCVWREEGRAPLAGLGLGHKHLVTVDRTGLARCLLLGHEERGRASFFEIKQEVREARREPAWTVPLPPRHGPFMGRVALSHDGRWLAARVGSTVTIWDRRGRPVWRMDGGGELRPVWGEGGRLFLVHPAGISACDLPGKNSWRWRGQVRDVSTGNMALGIALLDGLGTVRRLEPDGTEAWARDLGEEPLSVHADEDLEVVGVSGLENRFYLLARDGRPLWRRPLPRGAQVLLAGKHVYMVGAEGEVSCYGYGEQRDWRAPTCAQVSHLFREGERAFLATRDNRFYRLEPEGGLTPLDRRSDGGRSRLARTAEDQWRELHVVDRRLTCFDLEGSILWTWTAGGPIDPGTLTSGGGCLAFVAGQEIVFFHLEKGEEALPTRFLEL